MVMRETKNIEFKESITNTFLKTVSAFANYEGGYIYFGIEDSGKIIGLEDVKSSCLDIENKINDSITPQPDYTLEVLNNDSVVKLTVKSGLQKPYLYKSKAYKRNDTATIEVDTVELTRLVLEGKNISFEELASKDQNLLFNVLEKKLKEFLNLNSLSQDILKTLNLYNNSIGYNNAAALLADHNDFPGIDLVKFGANINIIQRRVTIDRRSVLQVYDEALELFRVYYTYEEIQGSIRQKVETIPEKAFREAIANALIHRTWDVDPQIKVSMFDDRIEINSPGGLPSSISKDEYLSGKLSILRNRNLASVFYRLGYVEIFGTGILRIKHLYANSFNQPKFEVFDNSITIVLPVWEEHLHLTADERKVYSVLSRTVLKSISEIAPHLDFGKTKTTQLLNSMVKRGIVKTEGQGRGTKYLLKGIKRQGSA